MIRIGAFIIVLVGWLLPIIALINNRLDPSFSSGLGVAYGFVIGGALHFILLVGWLIYRRNKITGFEMLLLYGSQLLIVVLAFLGNSGRLSVF